MDVYANANALLAMPFLFNKRDKVSSSADPVMQYIIFCFARTPQLSLAPNFPHQ